MSDRTVHAETDGGQIVRYERAGKWYYEPTNIHGKRRMLTVGEAAYLAHQDRMVVLNQPGGTQFRSKCAALRVPERRVR